MSPHRISGWPPDCPRPGRLRACCGRPPTSKDRDAMFDKAMTKSIQGYLEPGEELLNATIVQGKGLAKMFLAGGVGGASAVAARRDRKSSAAAADAPEGAVQLASKMG